MGDVSKIFVKFALGQCPVGRIGCHFMQFPGSKRRILPLK